MGTSAALTVTVQVAVFWGLSTDVQVMVAVPAPLGVTLPFLSTMATSSLSDFHMTDGFAVIGVTVAVSCLASSPSVKVSEDGLIVTPSTVA